MDPKKSACYEFIPPNSVLSDYCSWTIIIICFYHYNSGDIHKMEKTNINLKRKFLVISMSIKILDILCQNLQTIIIRPALKSSYLAKNKIVRYKNFFTVTKKRF